VFVPVPHWFIAYLIVTGELGLRTIEFRGEGLRSVCEQQLGLRQCLQAMRTIEVLSTMLGLEAAYPGLSSDDKVTDLQLDAIEVDDVHGAMNSLGQLERFIALEPLKLTLKLKNSLSRDRHNGGRVTSERLREIIVEELPYSYLRPNAYECGRLLRFIVTAAPQLRDLNVRVQIEGSEPIRRIQGAVESLKGLLPNLEPLVLGMEVVEFDLIAKMVRREVEAFLGSGHQLLIFGDRFEEENEGLYSRSEDIFLGGRHLGHLVYLIKIIG